MLNDANLIQRELRPGCSNLIFVCCNHIEALAEGMRKNEYYQPAQYVRCWSVWER